MGGGRAYTWSIDIFQNKWSIIPTVGWNSHIKCPYPRDGIETFSVIQCCSKGNISRGSCECQRREPLGGLGACSPRKFWNLEAWKCYFQCSPRAICDLCISWIIYLVRCLSKPMHIESITLETSITKQKTDYLCILKPANVSPFRVIIVSL